MKSGLVIGESGHLCYIQGSDWLSGRRASYTAVKFSYSALRVTCICDMIFKRLKDRSAVKQAIFRIMSGAKDK